MQLENHIKKLSHQNKEKIIDNPDLLDSFIKAGNKELYDAK